LKLTADMVANYAVNLWNKNKISFSIYWNYDLQELEAILFIGSYCSPINGYRSERIVTVNTEPYFIALDELISSEEKKILLEDRLSCSMSELEKFLGKHTFEARLYSFVYRTMNQSVIENNDKYNARRKAVIIELSSSYRGEDISVEECINNGYLFTYNNTVYQIFPEKISVTNVLTNTKEYKTIYRLYWTRDIEFDDWMLPSLKDANIAPELFIKLSDFEKAQIIRDYQGFQELTGLNYDAYDTLEDALDSIIVGTDFGNRHKSHNISVEENSPFQEKHPTHS